MGNFSIKIKARKSSFVNPYELTLKENHGRYAGVYVMLDNNDAVIYVGKTQDLGVRMKAHMKSSSFFMKVERLDLYSCDGGYERELLETYLIEKLRPLHNKSKTYFRENEYAEDVEELDYEIGELLTDVADLRRDMEGISVEYGGMYDKDTVISDRRLVLEEIQEKSDRVTVLRSRKQRLIIMRTV